MLFDEYQKEALKTVKPSCANNFSYSALGLSGEAGEVAEKVKKIIRDKEGVPSDRDRAEIIKECGDVLWYLAKISHEMDYNLETVAQMNLTKLRDRQTRDVISGEGDNR